MRVLSLHLKLPSMLLWVVVFLLATRTNVANDFDERRARSDSQFREELTSLADKCDELSLSEQAAISRQWIIERDPRRQYAFLPASADPHRPAAAAPELVQFWYRKFVSIRNEQADRLFAQARDSIAASQPDRAYRLLYEVLRENPDHEDARRCLGFSGSAGRWRSESDTPSSKPMRLAHPQFAWPPRRHWRVETAHFQISTSHSIKQGLELGRQLEMLHDVWRQLFYRYWGNDAELAASFAGERPRVPTPKKYKVVLFRDRDEYISQLGKVFPGIEVSKGFYQDSQSTAYFYAGDETELATWYHEVTHQLFHETGAVAAEVGRTDNFWIIEGIALYMESLIERDGYVTVGGFDAPRLQHARYRALNHRVYVPLAEFSKLGRDDLQKDERIRVLYTQAAGLAHFLMDHGDGRYRAAAIEYLRTIYTGRERADTLVKLTEVNFAELDSQYHEFLNVRAEEAARYLSPPQFVTILALGHTETGDETLALLDEYTKLTWLDLAFTKTSDSGVAHLARATELLNLNLENTQVTDLALETIGGLRQLEDLDLSNTQITDAGLERLKGLTKLKVLWLTGTTVTDEGLSHLRGMKQLEKLVVANTSVTAEGLATIKRVLPALRD